MREDRQAPVPLHVDRPLKELGAVIGPAHPEVVMGTYEEEVAREIAEAEAAEKAKAALAQTATEPSQGQVNQAMLTALNELLARNVGPVPQVPFAKLKARTPWNPTGEKYARGFTRPTYLNGFRLREKTHTQEEIDLLNRVQPGSYRNGKWTVMERTLNENGDRAIFIFFPNRTPEQRMDTMQEGRTLSELLTKLLAEQDARPRVTLAA